MREFGAEPESADLPAGAPAPSPSRPVDVTTFVGRERELSDLRRDLDAIATGEGRAALIVGDPGIGKTRLAWELARETKRRDAIVLWGRCWEAGGAPPYWPWIEILRAALACGHLPEKIDLGYHGAYATQLVPHLGERLVHTGPTPPEPTDPESGRFLMFDAVAQLLRGLATVKPVLVVADDLHAADHTSLLLFEFLTRSLHDAGVLLIGILRDTDARLRTDLAGVLADIGRQAKRVVVSGLSEREVLDLVGRSAETPPCEALAARIHAATGGNPFFVDEIVRLLRGSTSLETVDAAEPLPIPRGVRDAMRRRLQQLSDETVLLLELGAVVGSEFDVALLGLASGYDPMTILELLERPVLLDVVFRVPATGLRFAFRHVLIREVLYEDIPAARRLVLHRKIGEALEALGASDPGADATAVAHHFLVAAPASPDARFIDHATRAARQALSRMAFQEAVDLYQRTLDALPFAPDDESVRCRILLALGEAKEWANDLGGSRAMFERAAAIARRIRNPVLLVEAALGIGGVAAIKFTAGTRCEAAPNLLLEALAAIDPDDATSRSRLLSRLALHHLSSGARSEAARTSEEAVVTARKTTDLRALGHALIARNAALIGPDLIEQRAMIAEELLAIGRQLESRELILRGHAVRFTVHFEIGDLVAADQALDEHARLAAEAADPFERWANLVWRGERALLEGKFDEAEHYARLAFELATSTPGLHATEPYGLATFVGQSMHIDEARHDRIPDITITEQYRAAYPEVSTWRIAALTLYSTLGRMDDALRELEIVARKDFLDIERNGSWLATLSYLSEAVAFVGDRARARALYDLLLPFADRNATASHVACRGSVSRWLGILAATLGRWNVAESHLKAALEMNRRMGARPFVAATAYDYGRLMAMHGGADARAAAGRLLAEATELATALGMARLVERCRATAAQLPHSDMETQPTGDSEIELRKQGAIWTLTDAGVVLHLKDAKGLSYIAELLRHPGREVHVLDLLRTVADDESFAAPTATTTEIIDQRSRREYARRLDVLNRELEVAESEGDPERTLILGREVDALRGELTRAVGMFGRPRSNSDAERARISVTRAIRLAVRRIADADAQVAARLSRAIRTGIFCRYVPD